MKTKVLVHIENPLGASWLYSESIANEPSAPWHSTIVDAARYTLATHVQQDYGAVRLVEIITSMYNGVNVLSVLVASTHVTLIQRSAILAAASKKQFLIANVDPVVVVKGQAALDAQGLWRWSREGGHYCSEVFVFGMQPCPPSLSSTAIRAVGSLRMDTGPGTIATSAATLSALVQAGLGIVVRQPDPRDSLHMVSIVAPRAWRVALPPEAHIVSEDYLWNWRSTLP